MTCCQVGGMGNLATSKTFWTKNPLMLPYLLHQRLPKTTMTSSVLKDEQNQNETVLIKEWVCVHFVLSF
jgi:hypothetical protein